MPLTIDVDLPQTPPPAPKNKIVIEIFNEDDQNLNDLNLSCNSDINYCINFIEKMRYSVEKCDTKEKLENVYRESYLEWIPSDYKTKYLSILKVINILKILGYIYTKQNKIFWINNKKKPINTHILLN
jgi:biopolymer transport protein ExbD